MVVQFFEPVLALKIRGKAIYLNAKYISYIATHFSNAVLQDNHLDKTEEGALSRNQID